MQDLRVLAMSDMLSATTPSQIQSARDRLVRTMNPYATNFYLQRKPIIDRLIARYKEITSGKEIQDKAN